MKYLTLVVTWSIIIYAYDVLNLSESRNFNSLHMGASCSLQKVDTSIWCSTFSVILDTIGEEVDPEDPDQPVSDNLVDMDRKFLPAYRFIEI